MLLDVVCSEDEEFSLEVGTWRSFIFLTICDTLVFPGGSDGKESACNFGDPSEIPEWGRFPWKRKWQPTPIFLHEEFHGQRSLGRLQSMNPWVAKSQTQLSDFHFLWFLSFFLSFFFFVNLIVVNVKRLIFFLSC